MAGLKEIKRRVRSVQNTSKITYAMKLVSAAKLKRVQDAVSNFRSYSKELSKLVAGAQAGLAGSQFTDVLIEPRTTVSKVAVLVIGGQRGLCGGYNSGVHRKLESFLKDLTTQGKSFDLYAVGKKPAEFLRRIRRPIVASYEDLPENAALWPIAEIAEKLRASFSDHNVDEVHIIYTQFKSAISLTPVVQKLLPLVPESASTEAEPSQLKFEPTAEVVFRALLPRIIDTKIRDAALNAKASETASRMTAMDAATRNAKQLTKRLQILANKLRQQGITSQLLDIIGGAEAVN